MEPGSSKKDDFFSKKARARERESERVRERVRERERYTTVYNYTDDTTDCPHYDVSPECH